MHDTRQPYIMIFGNNVFDCCALILSGWFRRLKLLVMTDEDYFVANRALKYVFYIRRYMQAALKQGDYALGDHTKTFYLMNDTSVELTLSYYDRHIRDNKDIVGYYNTVLRTNKFEAYVKKHLAHQVFLVLEDLHLVKLSGLIEGEILMVSNTLNRFIVRHMEESYKIRYRITWVSAPSGLFSLGVYYLWLIKEFFRRGIVFNKPRKSYKVSREAAMGFYGRTLRDDIIIDNDRFKKSDMLMLEFDPAHDVRVRAFKEARQRGLDTASLPGLKININRNIFRIFFFYFCMPLKSFVQLLFKQRTPLFDYVLLFHRESFPIEIFMNLYDIGCHISSKDWGDVETTIILNRYGAKIAIFHWSDMTPFKDHLYAFNAHNIYFAWGDVHYDMHSKNYFVDKKINVGCILKKEYSKAVNGKVDIISRIAGYRKEQKTIVFFDNSVSLTLLTDRILIQYLSLILESCGRYKDLNILLKPKSYESYEPYILPHNRKRFNEVWNDLRAAENFIYMDSLRFGVEEAIAISDVCINMGMNSPATIALICGKNALYYEKTGNVSHPFARKYWNKIVFDDRGLLLKQVDNILEGKFDCKDIIKNDEIRQFDSFADDDGLERIRKELYFLTKRVM